MIEPVRADDRRLGPARLAHPGQGIGQRFVGADDRPGIVAQLGHRPVAQDGAVATERQVEAAPGQLDVEERAAESARGDEIGEHHRHHRRDRQIVAAGQFEDDHDGRQRRPDHRAEHRRHAADRIDRDTGIAVGDDRTDGRAAERAEQDSDQHRRREHPADEAEADAQGRHQDLGDDDGRQLAKAEGALDRGEAQHLLADAQDLRQLQGHQPEGQAGQHRPDGTRPGHERRQTAAERQKPHEDHRHQRPQHAEQREQHELVPVLHALEMDQEERRPAEDDVGDDIARRGRDRDRRERLQRVVPQDHLVGEDEARDRRVEGRGDGRGHAAGDGDRLQVAHAEAQARRRRPDHGAEIDQRAVLPDRGAAAEREQGRQGRGHAAAQTRWRGARLDRQDRVRRAQCPLLRDEELHDQADDQAARRRHQNRRGDQRRLARHMDARMRGDQETLVHEDDQFHEPDRRQRRRRPHDQPHRRQHGDALDALTRRAGREKDHGPRPPPSGPAARECARA